MLRFITVAILGLSLAACDNAIFSSSNGNNKAVGFDEPVDPDNPNPEEIPDLIFIDDSFEREELPGDENVFVGWRGAWDDHGTLGVGFTGNQLGMEIFNDQEMGPAAEGNSATYFYGRPGSSIHRLWLVSPVFDLSDYNTVILNFDYLTVALNDQEDIDANYIEGIRLQVCNAGANECGVNADFIDINNIASENWVTVTGTESDPNADDDVFDGTNQVASDYKLALGAIDLNDPNFVGDKSEFVFRFEVDMRDGFDATTSTTTPNPDYDEHKCKKYTKKKKRYCEKAEHKCKKAERYAEKCGYEDHEHGGYDTQSGYELLTQTYGHSDHCGRKGHAYGHCIQDCIKGNIGHDAKHECLRSCKSCKKAKHYKKKCKKYTKKCERYTKKKEKYCDKGDTTTTGGTLIDGVILDAVRGRATVDDISIIF